MRNSPAIRWLGLRVETALIHTREPGISLKGSIMEYVDGFVAAVPTANRNVYRKHAESAAAVFKQHGALRVVECWGDDVPEGKLTSFPMAVKRKEDETVVFSWITWPFAASPRRRHEEGDRRSAAAARPEPDAVRWQTADLRRIRGAARRVIGANPPKDRD